MKQSTIYDVAERAGVATSTVSRAFGVPGRVSERTRQRILAAAKEIGYVPNPHASALQSGRKRTIAMVVADITNPHFFELIRGAEQRAKAAGHTMVLVNAEESPRIEIEQVRGLVRQVDGFVLASSRLSDQDLLGLAADHEIVLLSRELPGLTSVTLDMGSGCRQILEHLVSLGHTELTYCAGPTNSWMGAARWSALRAGAEEQGIRVHRVGPYTPTVASGGAAADAALRAGTTALVAHNDLLAIGVMRRLAARGVRVPDDVSVLGFDDMFAADVVTPALTTLGGPFAGAGRLAVELLLGKLSADRGADNPEQTRLPTELMLRQSSGVAPVGGRLNR
ncbi:LacI family DNA-binding transcriptional regulator [Aeromicrobium sp. CF3.5]|uniref:LacI family DNA-binding transcriptional regulator n=1 Tax=Aeromicrobium sp. CF3.5 TaxID=3373078 RepID=UPI003EE450B6